MLQYHLHPVWLYYSGRVYSYTFVTDDDIVGWFVAVIVVVTAGLD